MNPAQMSLWRGFPQDLTPDVSPGVPMRPPRRERSQSPKALEPPRVAGRCDLAGGVLDPRPLSRTKIERLDYSPIPHCHALPGGQKAALRRVQNCWPPQPGHKGAAPRFISPVGLGCCPGRRRATNALKRANAGDTVRGPSRRCGTALWIALGGGLHCRFGRVGIRLLQHLFPVRDRVPDVVQFRAEPLG